MSLKERRILNMSEIPYKIYLSEEELPKQWYNVRADMKTDHAPIFHPGTLKPVVLEDLTGIFCTELAKQELNWEDRFIDIPGVDSGLLPGMYRPSPLVRAYCLEKELNIPRSRSITDLKVSNTSGSNKLNSAVAQAYLQKSRGSRGGNGDGSGPVGNRPFDGPAHISGLI